MDGWPLCAHCRKPTPIIGDAARALHRIGLYPLACRWCDKLQPAPPASLLQRIYAPPVNGRPVR